MKTGGQIIDAFEFYVTFKKEKLVKGLSPYRVRGKVKEVFSTFGYYESREQAEEIKSFCVRYLADKSDEATADLLRTEVRNYAFECGFKTSRVYSVTAG